jgi:hypothetical protein
MKLRTWHFASATAVLFAGMYASRAEQPPAAPVPPLIAAAQTVFIANGGTEFITKGDPGNLRSAFAGAGGADLGYDDFYAAMKSWGRYRLVASPAEADLVMEFHVIASYDGVSYPDSQCAVQIFDGKTHFLLWGFSEPLNGANRKSSFEKNTQTSVDAVLVTLKGLSAAAKTP